MTKRFIPEYQNTKNKQKTGPWLSVLKYQISEPAVVFHLWGNILCYGASGVANRQVENRYPSLSCHSHVYSLMSNLSHKN